MTAIVFEVNRFISKLTLLAACKGSAAKKARAFHVINVHDSAECLAARIDELKTHPLVLGDRSVGAFCELLLNVLRVELVLLDHSREKLKSDLRILCLGHSA